MLIKPKEGFEIPEDDPFKNDKLDRRQSAEVLKDLLSNINEPFVLAVDSPYGTGKTTFLKMFTQLLKKDGFRCISFNAWENDYMADPLAALVGALSKDLGKGKLAAKVKTTAKAVLKRIIPVGLKIATIGALDADKELEKIVSEYNEKQASDLMDGYEKQIDAVKKFKESLSEYANDGKADSKPVVFIIDELDRCRPDFALELLERIKHFFNVEGYIFILAYDKKQMGSMLKTIYGQELDVNGYLHRFIDLEYKMPRSSPLAYIQLLFQKHHVVQYFEKRAQKDRYGQQYYETIQALLVIMPNLFEMSLRAQERCLIQVSMVLLASKYEERMYPYVLVPLIVIRNHNSELYNRYIQREANYKDILDYIQNRNGGVEFLRSNDGTNIEAYFVLCESSAEVKKYRHERHSEMVNETTLGKERISRIADIIINQQRGEIDILDNIIPKLEMIERFHDFNERDEEKNS